MAVIGRLRLMKVLDVSAAQQQHCDCAMDLVTSD